MRLLQAARLSRLGDASTGLDKQDAAGQRYADAFGHEIIGTAADTDVSGNTRPFDRPKLGPWLNDRAMIEQYDGIIAAHLDRLGRNVRHLSELHAWAEANGKVLITVEPNIDWSSDVGKLLWGIMSWLAEQELKAITRRSVETQKFLKQNGYLVGRPPFGYRIVPHGDHKTLSPDPDLVPYVRGMVERALRGDTLSSIVDWLEREGIATTRGGHWIPKTVSQVLRNESLIGRRTDIAGRTLLRFEGIIDPATHKALVAKLDSNPRRRGPVSTDPALLTGVVYCGICDRVMHRRRSVTKRKNGSEYIYEGYRCDGTPREPSTCKNMVLMADTDAWVNEWFLNGPVSKHERVEAITVPGNGHQDELDQNKRDISELDIDDADYPERLAALMAERKRLQALPVEPDQVEYALTGETVQAFWAALSTSERREFLVQQGIRALVTRDHREILIGDPTRIWWPES